MKVNIMKSLYSSDLIVKEIAVILGHIKNGRWEKEVEEIQQYKKAGDETKCDSLKKNLPCFTIAGTFTKSRKNDAIETYSKLIHLDYDHIENLADLKFKVEYIPYTYASFVSPSGNGLKVIVKTNGEVTDHEKYFLKIKEHYDKVVGVTSDSKVKDLARACFVSYDPDLYLNEDSEVYSSDNTSYSEDELKKLWDFTSNKETFQEGSRNSFIHLFACNANRNGYDQEMVINYASDYSDSTFTKDEIQRTIKSAYKNTSQSGSNTTFKSDSTYSPILDSYETSVPLISPQNELLNELNECKIDALEDIPPPDVAWEIKGNSLEFIIIGTHGNFSVVKGKAKSKKSFLINMAIAAAVGQKLLHNRLSAPLKSDACKVLYFDTEQSKYHVQKAVKRIMEQIDVKSIDNLITYGLRKKSPKKRQELVEFAIRNTPNLGFVVIDGIRDLITSINDEGESTEITSKLMELTEVYNFHAIVVVHENPGSDKARGHLGTELMNKAEAVIAVTVDSENPNISIVTPAFCKNMNFEPFAFEISPEGIPIIIESYTVSQSKKVTFDICALDNEKRFEIFKDTFSTRSEINRGDLVIAIKASINKLHRGIRGRGDNKIKSIITEGLESGLLVQEGDRKPISLGKL